MAVRFDAAADRIARTSGVLDYNSAYTWMAWVQLVSDLNAYGHILGINTNGSLDYDYVGVNGDGVSLSVLVDNNGAFTEVDSGYNFATGTWAHVAVVRSSTTSLAVFVNAAQQGSANTRSVSGRSAASRMEMGGFGTGNIDRADVRIADVRIFNAALTAAEIAAEMWDEQPQRATGLWHHSRLLDATDLQDLSENGRDWTAGGTLTREDGPPGVGWSVIGGVVPSPSAATGGHTSTASAAADLATASAALASTIPTYAATISAAAAAASASASLAVTQPGYGITAAASAPGATAAATASVTQPGYGITAAASAPGATGAALAGVTQPGYGITATAAASAPTGSALASVTQPEYGIAAAATAPTATGAALASVTQPGYGITASASAAPAVAAASLANTIPTYPIVSTIRPYSTRILEVHPANLIAYWPLDDASSSAQARELSGNTQRADYASSGVTYGVDGIGDGSRAVRLDGANTHVNVMTSVNTFDSLFDGNVFSMIVWGKVDDLTRWNDTSTYRYLTHIRAADTTYYVVMGHSTTVNQIEWRRRSGGAIVSQTLTFTTPPSGFFCMGITCDESLPEVRFYLWDAADGWRKVGTSTSASITDWGSNPPQEGVTVLGAGSLTLQEWVGDLAHAAVWAGVRLTDAEMQTVMTPIVSLAQAPAATGSALLASTGVSYGATAAATAAPATGSASLASTIPIFTTSAAATAPAATGSASASVTQPGYGSTASATADPASGSALLAAGALGAHPIVASASAPAASGAASLASTTPTYAGSASATADPATGQAQGASVLPAYDGTGVAIAPVPVASATLAATLPAYAVVVTAVAPPATGSARLSSVSAFAMVVAASAPPATGSALLAHPSSAIGNLTLSVAVVGSLQASVARVGDLTTGVTQIGALDLTIEPE